MAPLPATLLSLLPRSFSTSISDLSVSSLEPEEHAARSPMYIHDLHRRATTVSRIPPGSGAKEPTAFNNQAFLALFALIAAGMVVASIWFFFWAKNGGFVWRKGDWDDYKSTVLRRKGPDGKTLSNATKSTKLGGGSVVGGGSYGAESSVGYTDETGSAFTSKTEMREMHTGDNMRGGGARYTGDNRQKDRDQRRAERQKDRELREYQREKPARVGGLNGQHDGSHYDYSNASDLSQAQRPLTAPAGAPKDTKRAQKEREKREKERRREAKVAAKTAAANAKKDKAAEAERKKEQQKARKAPKDLTSPSSPSNQNLVTPSRDTAASPTKANDRPRRSAPSNAYSFTTGDDTGTVYTAPYTDASSAQQQDSYYSSYRPHAESPTKAPRTSQSRSRQSSPRKHHSRPHNHGEGSRSRHASRSRTDLSSDLGTKSYPCYIPGVSSSRGEGSLAPDESISQVGAPGRRQRDVMDGYRRGRGRGRRDSLSDSGEE
ncbi:hypothetical protein W97_04916 [Coniosporium apollinis CBS 100218]|uniref:Uncharacterized protein n=1 Tax=Coniosporium apollinis (strain CBS 100218) TaxID=1168221 RepID=R7YUU9_CONA1|nr:uncharacterized protein W97_04916 [Coniosporium apollinis CBS 100218]EON65677.1 hypothetical protein W97_04916 [Coniosporium apollinis CBS 100218]